VELAELSEYLDTTRDRISIMHDPDFDPYLPPRAPVGFKSRETFDTNAIEGNPWVTIWTQPRGTIRGIVASDPNRNVALLSIVYGVIQLMSQALDKNLGDKVSLPSLLAIFLVVGPIFGLLWNLFFGTLGRWTGSWIGGVATFQESRAALAWGTIPAIFILPLYVGMIVALGQDLFREQEAANLGMQKGIGLIAIGLGQVILGIWSLVTTIKCVAEVHRFSAWKSLGALLLASVIFVGICMVVAILLVAIFGLPNPSA
jgi:Yip1 domain